MAAHAATIGRAHLAIQVVGLLVVIVGVVVISWAAWSGAARSEARQVTEFDFLTRVSQAQTCALVGVVSLPSDDRAQDRVQSIVNDCYQRSGVIAEAPTVDE